MDRFRHHGELFPTGGISDAFPKIDQPMSRIGSRLRQYREIRASREPLRGKKTAMNARLLSACLAIAFTAVALLALTGLHVVSPEFDPAKRVVSEYALGRHGWLLSVMFLSWGLGTWSLVPAIQSDVNTLPGRIGLVLLVTTGVGEAMAAFFDVNWPKMHGLAGAGSSQPASCRHVDQLSLSRHPLWRSQRRWLLVAANLTWLALVFMATAMLFLGSKPTNRHVPIGWPNRLLVVIYCVWVILVGLIALRMRRDATPRCRNMLRHTDEGGRVLRRPIASAAEKRKTKIRQLRAQTINRSFSGRLPDRPETRRSHDIGPRETHQENQNTGNSSNPGFLIVVFRTADPLCTSDGSQPIDTPDLAGRNISKIIYTAVESRAGRRTAFAAGWR